MRLVMLLVAILLLLGVARMLFIDSAAPSNTAPPEETVKKVKRQLDDAMVQSLCLNAIEQRYRQQSVRIRRLKDNRYQIEDHGNRELIYCQLDAQGLATLSERP